MAGPGNRSHLFLTEEYLSQLDPEYAWRRKRLDEGYARSNAEMALYEAKMKEKSDMQSAAASVDGATNIETRADSKGKGIAFDDEDVLKEKDYEGDNGEHAEPEAIVVLSDNERSEEDVLVLKDDNEVTVEDLGAGGRKYTWKRKIKSHRVASNNVLQLPQRVIQDCLMAGHPEITLYDSDIGRTYDCVLHFSQRQYCVERYIGHGWYDLVRNRKLKKGDRVGFTFMAPAADSLFVSVLNRKTKLK